MVMGDLKTVVLVLGCAANLLLVAGILWSMFHEVVLLFRTGLRLG